MAEHNLKDLVDKLRERIAASVDSLDADGVLDVAELVLSPKDPDVKKLRYILENLL